MIMTEEPTIIGGVDFFLLSKSLLANGHGVHDLKLTHPLIPRFPTVGV